MAYTSNISFEIMDRGVDFSFKNKNGDSCSACLQLPNTSDSKHTLDLISVCGDFDFDNKEQSEIFQKLKMYFYGSFPNKLCASAALFVGDSTINEVVTVGSYYVAFGEDESYAYILTEGKFSDADGNDFYFESDLDDLTDSNQNEIIEKARELRN